MSLRVVALDDYQGLVAEYQLDGRTDGAQWVPVREHLTGDALVSALADAPVIVAMRERTPFNRELFAQLPSLRLPAPGPGGRGRGWRPRGQQARPVRHGRLRQHPPGAVRPHPGPGR